jgi:hypothetical protein
MPEQVSPKAAKTDAAVREHPLLARLPVLVDGRFLATYFAMQTGHWSANAGIGCTSSQLKLKRFISNPRGSQVLA